MPIETTDEDIPMSPGSDVMRARLQRTQTANAGAASHGEDSLSWGDFAPAQIWDNENWDDPRQGWSLAEVAQQSGLKVVRCQKRDPDKDELLALVRSPMFREVEYLDLRRNFRSPSDAEWAEIIATGALSHLRMLSLDSCYPVGDATLAAIGSGAMPALEALELGSTETTDAGLRALTDATKTPALQVVQGMFMDKLSEAGARELAAARPGLTLRFSR